MQPQPLPLAPASHEVDATMNSPTATRHEVTRLLAEIEREPDSLKRLTELVYDDIRRLAHHQQSGSKRSPTLQTTALVHEAFLKVFDKDLQSIENRQHLIRLMGCAMRQIIVDHARSRLAQKRGGDRTPSGLDPDELAGDLSDARQMLDIERAFQQLERLDADLAELVAARFFAGYTTDELAESQGVSRRTVQRQLKRANVWLRLSLENPGP